MNTNNFVSRLSEKDFFEFLSENYYGNGLDPDCKITIFREASFPNDTDPGYRVIVKKEKLLKQTEIGAFVFYNFFYLQSRAFMLDDLYTFSSSYEDWRKFMAKKFGVEYIEAYKAHTSNYFREKIEFLCNVEKECNAEIDMLSKEIKHE